MKASQLIEALQVVDPDKEVEIATSEHKDEWYEIADCTVETNLRGNVVFVINTD